MTEEAIQSQTHSVPAEAQQNGFAQIAEWKTQLTALAAAPFFGIGFVIDLLLRVKDFPERASAMWGVVVLLVGCSFFFLCLLGAALLATISGGSKRDISGGSKPDNQSIFRKALVTCLKAPAKCLPTLFFGMGIVTIIIGYVALQKTGHGFGHFVTPYIEWLNKQPR